MGGFSLYEQLEVTNHELVINYKPSASIVKYTYRIYKDDKFIGEMFVTTNRQSTINLIESGSYKIEVSGITKDNKTVVEKSGIYNIDVDKPIMGVSDNILKMKALKKGQTLVMEDLRDYLKVIDKQDGDLFDKTTCNLDEIDYSKIGLYNLKCTVADSADNVTENTFKFIITKNNSSAINIFQGIVILVLFIAIIFISRYIKAINLEKKVVRYSVTPIKDNKISTFEKARTMFRNVIKKVSEFLKKSVIITKHSKKYDKYEPFFHYLYDDSIEFVSFKIILGFIFIIITFVAKTLELKSLTYYELFIPFLFGYYFPNAVCAIKYRIYRNRLENDLLQAITIMNNAFKSGRSIIQAIELVGTELKGPIGEEFKKMFMELNFGLEIETVFNRFAKRIDLEEVTYLTATLSILNRTGGNIIKVFSSIEKSLFDKKKLKLEMRSLTGASKMIVWVLFLVPFLFIAFISIISKDYFAPLYSNPLGFALIGIMLLIYFIYIIIIRKIMKVKM